MMQPRNPVKQVITLLAFLATLLCASGVGAQQPNVQTEPSEQFLNTSVPSFEMSDQTLVDGLWKLASAPQPFGFGFEHVLKKRSKDPDIPDLRFSLQLKNKTIREVLDALCQADPRFTWSMDGATVNVFPLAVINDSSYLLNRGLDRFELKNATDVDEGLFAIPNQLPPPFEQIAHVQMNGDDPYPPEPWTVIFTNLTVRQVVNRLTAHGGACGTWIFGGSEEFHAFGFFNTFLCDKEQPPWISTILDSRRKAPQQ